MTTCAPILRLGLMLDSCDGSADIVGVDSWLNFLRIHIILIVVRIVPENEYR